uniref:Flavin containing amine oxidoreductase n=1 Tax=Pithovirus LCPAC202 TaxID=2506592 RepID=A0A481Z5S5_9VIRU|nr:MAG: flavin containing amine oxidoreductase [Pithovirus LCPAC202]
MSGTKIVIIGAGPTALGAGHRLMELGVIREYHQITFFEQNNQPGGLASTVRDNVGFLWDLGGHVVFSHYNKFTKLLDEAVPEWNYHQRQAYALLMDSDNTPRYVPYPIQHNLQHLSSRDQVKCLEGLRKLPKGDLSGLTFDDWIKHKFGSGLDEIFMNPYNRKVWTVDPKMMNNSWVGERVPVPSYKEALMLCEKSKRSSSREESSSKGIDITCQSSGNLAELLKNGEIKRDDSDGKSNKKQDSGWGPNKSFRFPKRGGTGSIWKSVAQKLPSSWIKYGYKVLEVDISNKRLHLVHIQSKEKFWMEYDILISTMPLNLLLKSIRGSEPNLNKMKEIGKKFVYNAVHVVGIGLKGKMPTSLENKTWLYLPKDDSPFYRISIFSRYSDSHVPNPDENWSLLCEASEVISAWGNENWKLSVKRGDQRVKEILSQTVPSLLKYGLIKDKSQIISVFHKRLDQGYPVPFLERDQCLSIVQPWLESNNIFSRGRFGGWKYEVSNQDHSFMQGVEVIDRILLGIPEMTYYHPRLVNGGMDSGRSQPLMIRDRNTRSSQIIKFLPFKKTPEVVYVIAQHNENLSWLKDIGISDKSYVYHKGGKSIPRFDIWRWESLPNIGRETHTYLTYIVKHYHSLPEIVIFLQGKIDDHIRDVYQNPVEYFNQTKKFGYSFKHSEVYDNWGRIKHNGIFPEKLRKKQMKIAPYTFGEFWKIIFGFDHPRQILITYSACFGISRERLLSHPLSFYKKCLSFVSDHTDPEIGHYFERLWYSIATFGH